jgi:protein-tyrosine phosphatase
MDKAFWLEAGWLAARPGPNAEPWDLAELRDAGIGAVLTVNDAQACDAQAFVAADIEHACIPFSRNAPPLPGDDRLCIEALPRAYEFATGAMARGQAVLVHCTFGKDRTGLFLAYYLIRCTGMAPGEAIARVREVRPIALGAQGWDVLAAEVLDRCTCRSTGRAPG